MTQEEMVLGCWEKVKVLGLGGFGEVTLWQKKNTDEFVAIKRLRENDCCQEPFKSKKMDRWCKEVEMMKKLNHPNVVRVSSVPEELKSLSKHPILAMEYCGLGDLRQVLNKTENCCGLPESTIIKILKDVSGGLSYLHSCKVIHRDLKPDNIVLQSKGSEILYKLIDLGYAKELDQNSVCKSFVGTVQYLAPELFLGKIYTNTVDYWSFGVLAHEIITGYRPFLPGSHPPEWMNRVQNKPRNIISVIENLNGETVFSSAISRVNHVSRCLLAYIEKWLQLALDWNGELRGRDPATKELLFFSFLNEILDKMTVKVFSLPTYEILCYEIKADTDVATLRTLLERDTGINVDEQILLLRNGRCLESTGILANCLKNEVADPDNVSIFLYNCGSMKIRSRVVLKPLYVKELLEDPKKVLSYKHLKRSCSDSVFLLQSELKLYTCLLESLKVKIINLQSREHSVESLFEDVADEWNQVESFAQFLMLSHKADLENYIQLRKGGELQSSELVQKWISKVTDVERKLSELRSTSNKNKLKLAVEEAKQKCKSLEGNEFLKANDQNVLKDLLNEGGRIWEAVQKIPKEYRNLLKSNTDTVKILYRCIECTTKMLRSPLLCLFFLQLSEAEEHLTKLVSPLTIWLKSTKIMKQIIENTQRERQREIWNLVVRQKTTPKSSAESGGRRKSDADSGKAPDSEFSPFHIPKTVRSELKSPASTEEEEGGVLRPNFRIMEPVSVEPYKLDLHVSRPDIRYSIASSMGTGSIITANAYLRHRVQEMNESWHRMMKEMRSLDWDSLNNMAQSAST